jgi:hypothetical protein
MYGAVVQCSVAVTKAAGLQEFKRAATAGPCGEHMCQQMEHQKQVVLTVMSNCCCLHKGTSGCQAFSIHAFVLHVSSCAVQTQQQLLPMTINNITVHQEFAQRFVKGNPEIILPGSPLLPAVVFHAATAALSNGNASSACSCACELNAKVVPALIYPDQTSDPSAAEAAADGSSDGAIPADLMQSELAEACYQTVVSVLQESGAFTVKAVHAVRDCGLQKCRATVAVSSSTEVIADDASDASSAEAGSSSSSSSSSSRLVDSAATKMVSPSQAASSSSSSSSLWLAVLCMVCAAAAGL